MKGSSRLKYVDFIFRLFLIISIVALIYFFIKTDELDLTELYIFNRKPIIVQTDTMEPVIRKGSMVVVKKAKIEDIKDRDVIAYRLDDRIIVHRAFIKNGELRTKADTDKRYDFYKINDDNLIGYVSLRVNLPIFKFLNISDTEEGVSIEDVEI